LHEIARIILRYEPFLDSHFALYNVSRWGRFVDADESAHEFMCKQANIPVHYCAESFANNNSLPSAIYKAMKRTNRDIEFPPFVPTEAHN